MHISGDYFGKLDFFVGLNPQNPDALMGEF